MTERIVRPSMKTVGSVYVAAAVAALASVWAFFTYDMAPPWLWLAAVPIFVFVWPLWMHLKRNVVTLRLQADRMTFETGFFSRTRRTVDVAKIQDVTVRQSLIQRLLNVGDLVLESAGEHGSMAIRNIDGPREIADTILDGSRRAANVRRNGME